MTTLIALDKERAVQLAAQAHIESILASMVFIVLTSAGGRGITHGELILTLAPRPQFFVGAS
jgi:predicted GNAT family N-acyltransferase